jgi:hypothetical protein
MPDINVKNLTEDALWQFLEHKSIGYTRLPRQTMPWTWNQTSKLRKNNVG